MNNGQLANIVEAMLFAAAEPLSVRVIGRVLEGTKTEDIEYALTALNQRYTEANASIRVREIAGGYQMCTLPEYAEYIEMLLAKTKKQRLSGAALETLAVIAYRQPVTGPEIEKIRGVESSGVLRTLLERKVISIIGRSEKPGRPLLYGTTREFLYYFGLNHLRELPRVEELEKLLRKRDTGEQIAIGLEAEVDETPLPQPETGEQVEESVAETPPMAPEPESLPQGPPGQADLTESEREADVAAPPAQRIVLKKKPEAVDVPEDTPVEAEDAAPPCPADEEDREAEFELAVPHGETEEEPEILKTAEEIVTSPVE